MATWQLQEAKTHFSKVVNKAMKEGPQKVTLRGKNVVVIIAQKEFERLKRPKSTLVEFMQKSPLVGIELNLKRDSSLTREIDL
jgi:antitoxin Phd